MLVPSIDREKTGFLISGLAETSRMYDVAPSEAVHEKSMLISPEAVNSAERTGEIKVTGNGLITSSVPNGYIAFAGSSPPMTTG